MRRKRIYTKEEMILAIKNSRTFADIIRYFKRSDSSGMRNVLKKYIKEYNIDISHFTTKKNYSNKKIPINEILVENSTYNRTSLKRRIINENILKYECKICGNMGKWKNKKLSLQLDHINGVNTDNRIKNLRFLCPNCHSQTPTFSGKLPEEEKKKRIEKKKNNIKNSHLKQRKIERPSYDVLLHEIKLNGYVGTGRKYGVSDNAIRKWIKYYEKNKIGG